MDPLKYRRALPVQLKILIPVSPDDRHRRLLASIREHFPPVSCRFFMTGLTDSEPSEASLTLRRDLETLTTEMLPDRYTHILIRTGNPVETILTTAVKQRCDLIILAHSNKLTVTFNNRQVRIKTLLRKTPLPILLVPDPPDTPSVTPIMPPQKIIIHLHPDEKNRLCSAFAMRCARLIQAPALLVSQSKPASEKQANDYLSFIRDRYWPLESPAACDVQCDTRKSTTLHALIRETGADMTILTCNDPGQRRRKQYIDQIKPLIDAPNHLILWVQRRDWVAGLEEKMRVIYKSLSDFELTTSKNKDAATQIPEPEMHVLDSSPQLLLGCYSMDGLEEVFRRYGLFDSFARRGYPGAHVLFDATDRHMDRLRVFPTRKIEGEPLVDLVFRREMMLPVEVFNNDGPPAEFPADLGPYLYIEWLCLQDPERSYRDLEIPLPGQRYPGLGLGWKVMIILKLLA
nr:universal stress protein [bacterium]